MSKDYICLTFSRRWLNELLRFAFPLIPSLLAFAIIDLSSHYILSYILGYESTGLYSTGHKLGIFMNLAVQAFGFAWAPFYFSKADQPDAKIIFARVLTYFCFIAGIIFIAVSFFVDEFVQLRIGYTFLIAFVKPITL